MPLTYAGKTGVGQPITERHERARKVKPQYTEGDLVRVAGAKHQAEAEFLQGLLLEEGIPSMIRPPKGYAVLDALLTGPRELLVPASGATAAREVLLEADAPVADPAPEPSGDTTTAIVLALAAAFAVVALIALLAS